MCHSLVLSKTHPFASPDNMQEFPKIVPVKVYKEWDCRVWESKAPTKGGTYTHARMYSFAIYVCLIGESMIMIVLRNFVKVRLKK